MRTTPGRPSMFLLGLAAVVVLASFSSVTIANPHSGTAAPVSAMAREPASSSARGPVTVTNAPAGAGALPRVSLPQAGPSSIALRGGWDGLDNRAACSDSCFPADPQVTAGGGYVFEVAGSAYRIWGTNGTLLQNDSMAYLVGTHDDDLTSPQVVYDPATLRWFVSVDDFDNNQVLIAGSQSSDPTGSWNAQHFNPSGGDVPLQPKLAVDSLNVVVTTDLYDHGSFAGAQVFVANKSQLLAGDDMSTWSNQPDSQAQSLFPAAPLGTSPVMYLVSDGTGGRNLSLFNLTGSPPGVVTLSSATVFPSVTAGPPAAVQRGSTNLVYVEDARVESAVWSAGNLWAMATVGCTPSGDSALRACLHLWELSTLNDSMRQDFNWSTGVGTYDYFPAASIDSLGNLAVVFDESSATAYPSVATTALAVSDPDGAFETAQLVRAGGGPDNATGKCASGVCPFGNSSGAAVAPGGVAGSFWVVGEYTGTDSATDFWHTWLHVIQVEDTYAVRLTESNLPAGTLWSVSVNGAVVNSSTPTIVLNESIGTFTYDVLSPIATVPGIQFVALPASGSFAVTSAPQALGVTYAEQFALNTTALPRTAGAVSPSAGWYNSGDRVNLTALAGPGFVFAGWVGLGPGAYAGKANPAVLSMVGPESETARFSGAIAFPVTFSESGLPAGTSWSVVLNGLFNGSTGASINLVEPNGSYAYFAATAIRGGAGVQYVANRTLGTFTIAGRPVSQSISYVTQYQFSTSLTPSNSGIVSPPAGWFDAGTSVNLSALAGAGYQFASWQGSGSGNYSGPHNPQSVRLAGPVSERATFSLGPSRSSTTSVGMVPLWEFLITVAIVAGLAVIVGTGLRGRRDPPNATVGSVEPVGSTPGTVAAGGVVPWTEPELPDVPGAGPPDPPGPPPGASLP